MSESWDVYTKDRKKTGKYLVCQRSADKETDPLKWETVAGHAVSGETSLDAALREVVEEVGITLQREKATVLATKVALTYDGCRHNWIRDSYYFETTDEPDLQKATTKEVVQTRWLTVPEKR